MTPPPRPTISQRLDRALGARDTTLTALSTENLKPGEKIVYAALVLLSLTDDEPVLRHELDVAPWVGMTPHQVRQAIAGLRRQGLVERGWFMLGERPTPAYQALPFPDEA